MINNNMETRVNEEKPLLQNEKCYVVGDKFKNFCGQENIITYSQLIETFNNKLSLPSKFNRYIIGQGINHSQLKNLQSKLSQVFDPAEIEIEEFISKKADCKLIHKKCEKNVLITTPIKVGDHEYKAKLCIDENCVEMSDHVTGRHVPGPLLIEAGRQMGMASCQLNVLDENQFDKYAFVLQKVETIFHSYAFPIEIDIYSDFFNIEWDKKGNIVKSISSRIKVVQLNQLRTELILKASVFPNRLLNSLENKQFLKHCASLN